MYPTAIAVVGGCAFIKRRISSNWEARVVLDASSIRMNNSKEDWSPCRGIQAVTLRRLWPSKTLTSSRFTTGISLPCLASTETTVLTGTVTDADCCADQDDMPQLNPITSPRIVDNAVFLHAPEFRDFNHSSVLTANCGYEPASSAKAGGQRMLTSPVHRRNGQEPP